MNFKPKGPGQGGRAEKTDGDCWTEAIEICGAWGKEARVGEGGARGEDGRQKIKRKDKTELHGGVGVGYWVWYSGCFAACRWSERSQALDSQGQPLTRHLEEKKQ